MEKVPATGKVRTGKILAISGVAILVVGIGVFMGFFSGIFKRGAILNTSATIADFPPHEENWTVYLSTIDHDKVGSIMVDLGLKAIAPVKERPNRVRIDITLRNLDENGFPTPDELDALNAIQDKIDAVFDSKYRAIFAGRLITGRDAFIYYYFADTDALDETLSETMAGFPAYKFDHKVIREADWISYFDTLYPLPIQMQSIGNGQVVESLRRQGDKLEKPRRVDHWIYFSTQENQDKFLESIKEQGFTVEGKDKISNSDKPFQLKISRIDKVDHSSVDAYVLDLWQKAGDMGGEYDGWETIVVKD